MKQLINSAQEAEPLKSATQDGGVAVSDSISTAQNKTLRSTDTHNKEREYYLLVFAEKPPVLGVYKELLQWQSLVEDLEKLPHLTANAELLFENAWLFPEKSEWRKIGSFLERFQGLNLKTVVYRIHGRPLPYQV